MRGQQKPRELAANFYSELALVFQGLHSLPLRLLDYRHSGDQSVPTELARTPVGGRRQSDPNTVFFPLLLVNTSKGRLGTC